MNMQKVARAVAFGLSAVALVFVGSKVVGTKMAGSVIIQNESTDTLKEVRLQMQSAGGNLVEEMKPDIMSTASVELEVPVADDSSLSVVFSRAGSLTKVGCGYYASLSDQYLVKVPAIGDPSCERSMSPAKK